MKNPEKEALEMPDPLVEEEGSLEITRIPEAALGKTMGRLMRTMHRRAGLKRADIAQRLGITNEEVRKLERGIPADELPFPTVVLFADACDCKFEMHIRTQEGPETGKETVFEF